jgi:hypothetical protein
MKHKILTLYWDDKNHIGFIEKHNTQDLDHISLADAIQDGFIYMSDYQKETIKEFYKKNKEK